MERVDWMFWDRESPSMKGRDRIVRGGDPSSSVAVYTGMENTGASSLTSTMVIVMVAVSLRGMVPLSSTTTSNYRTEQHCNHSTTPHRHRKHIPQVGGVAQYPALC